MNKCMVEVVEDTLVEDEEEEELREFSATIANGMGMFKQSAGGNKIKQIILKKPNLMKKEKRTARRSWHGLIQKRITNKCASKASGKVLVKASMTQNKLFPVDLTRVETCALIAQKEEVTALWHRRYGHININNLKMLQQKEMVKGMPVLGTLDICEACIYGKQRTMRIEELIEENQDHETEGVEPIVESEPSMETVSESSSSSEDLGPRGYKSLNEIFEATQALYVADPNSFEEAVKKELLILAYGMDMG
ncbi:hypothetical protein V6N12_057668 [Hibiscus sabdariffa]|uniref:GAG-pre-integrase domain-containing protein n=1 Tax=Hibiscus sabdariffa TaxID=183260 RepID=A0ABR2C5T2_9ROSI